MNLKKMAVIVEVIAALLTAGCGSTAPNASSAPKFVSEGFVRINGGIFMMGSPADEPGRLGWEGLPRQITVSSFYMGKYEVTQREWFEVMGTTVRQQQDLTRREWDDMMATRTQQMTQDMPIPSFPIRGEGDDYPMYYVSWLEAVEYCNALSRRDGLTIAYSIIETDVTWNRNANGYRLPTEAEWEYTCRAGTTTAYNTGAVISDTTGWYRANSSDSTQPVGQKLANPWGLHDMHGNIMEWTWDYSGVAQPVLEGAPVPEPGRVTRGGSWMDHDISVRSASRSRHPVWHRHDILGFRLVRGE